MPEISITSICSVDTKSKKKLPLYLSNVNAGFPSPAEDYLDTNLDLNEFLIKHPAATFFVKVQGDSMIGAGIMPGSTLVVDRSFELNNNKIIVAVIDGDFTVKRYKETKGKRYLTPENPHFKQIEITDDVDFEFWGIVTHVISAL